MAGTAASGMPGQQQCVPLHQPVDTLGVDRGQTVASPLALEERGDPPVPVGRADGLEFPCWNAEVVRVAFVLDCHDREVISWIATTAGISGEMIRDMMVDC